MTDEDPPPLKSSSGTPAELARALRALGERDRDPARLARVAERLGTRIAAGPPPAASWLRTLVTTKTGLIGLVLAVGVLGVVGYGLIADQRAPAPTPAAVPTPTSAPAPMPLEVVATPATQVPAPATPSRPAPTITQPAPAFGGQRVRLTRSTEHSRANPSAAATSQPAPPPPPATAPAGTEAKLEPVPVKTAPAEVQPPAKPAAAAETPPTPPPSEVALLQNARKLAVKQPASALSVLHEHAQRFPNGLLEPEREVLTIEVLRRLGRSAEAAQRLQQFEAQYPKSLYLRRLHEPATSE